MLRARDRIGTYCTHRMYQDKVSCAGGMRPRWLLVPADVS